MCQDSLCGLIMEQVNWPGGRGKGGWLCSWVIIDADEVVSKYRMTECDHGAKFTSSNCSLDNLHYETSKLQASYFLYQILTKK